MKICYEPHKFQPKTLKIVEQADEIIEEYKEQGFDLTLRQLFYQFVSRDLISNNQTEYKRLGDIISKARRAGYIDWDAIVDRTRNLQKWSSWKSPESVILSAAYGFQMDLWRNQDFYVEIWFEKDALMGVFERAAEEYRIPYFSCRGYVSDSEIWSAAQRLKEKVKSEKDVVIFHFGDHDPSGLDMSRDIEARLNLFGLWGFEVRRLALNFDQIQKYNPPPNPAKETDARFKNYAEQYGDESWELDALSPTILAKLVENELMSCLNLEQWDEDKQEEDEKRKQLELIANNYGKVREFLWKK